MIKQVPSRKAYFIDDFSGGYIICHPNIYKQLERELNTCIT
jgi:hypothetical protein